MDDWERAGALRRATIPAQYPVHGVFDAWAPGYDGFPHRGPVAQLGARLNGIQKVRGSNPLGSTTKCCGLG